MPEVQLPETCGPYLPMPGDLSGYINSSLRWMHSVWDPATGWVDVGYDCEQAEKRAAEIKASALGVREDPKET